MSLRKLYYLLPAGSRLLLRKIVYWPEDLWDQVFSRDLTLQPPKRLIFTGRGSFLKTGIRFLKLFQSHGGLNPQSKILDIGSGIGRIAIPLTEYLDSKGTYDGFDLVEQGVKWCKENIEAKFDNFKFTLVNLKNELYQSHGNEASNFIFPYNPEIFDLAVSISVFTHLELPVIQQYLNQIFNVLKPGGRCIATFFLIDDEMIKSHFANTHFNFKYQSGEQYMIDQKIKTANTAYREKFMIHLIKSNGFKLNHVIHGNWRCRNSTDTEFFQDILIFSKPD